MQIRILESAEADLHNSALFYENLAPGLGFYFLECLEEDVDSLHVCAGVHLKIAGFHRLLSRHFPFAVYYQIEWGRVDVWAILSCRADPEGITKHLGDLM